MDSIRDAITQSGAPLEGLDDMLKRLGDAVSSLPPDKLLLKEDEIRVELGGNSYVVLVAPLGDTLAQFSDMIAERRSLSEVTQFILSKCLRAYRIEAAGEVLDSKTIPERRRAEVFIRRVSPTVVTYVVVKLMDYIRTNQLSGLILPTSPQSAPAGQEPEMVEIPVE